MIEFKGRVLLSGVGQASAVVTKKEVWQIKAFGKSSENKRKKLLFSDKSHPKIYKKNITDKALVLPSFKQSDINSMVLLSVAKKNILPKCFLFAGELDSATVAAFALAKVFMESEVTVIDSLGEEFLNTVENQDLISFNDDTVTINF